jgi:hypothetical protein
MHGMQEVISIHLLLPLCFLLALLPLQLVPLQRAGQLLVRTKLHACRQHGTQRRVAAACTGAASGAPAPLLHCRQLAQHVRGRVCHRQGCSRPKALRLLLLLLQLQHRGVHAVRPGAAAHAKSAMQLLTRTSLWLLQLRCRQVRKGIPLLLLLLLLVLLVLLLLLQMVLQPRSSLLLLPPLALELLQGGCFLLLPLDRVLLLHCSCLLHPLVRCRLLRCKVHLQQEDVSD